MSDPESCFDPNGLIRHRNAAGSGFGVIRNCRGRRDGCCSFSRPFSCDQHGDHADEESEAQPDQTDAELRHIIKFSTDDIFQTGTECPGCQRTEEQPQRNGGFAAVQGLQPYHSHDLAFAHPDAAHHAEKLRPAGDGTGETPGDHEDPSQQDKYGQRQGDREE